MNDLMKIAAAPVAAATKTQEQRLQRICELQLELNDLLDAEFAASASMRTLADIEAACRRFKEASQTVLAIRVYRRFAGATLREAKDFVDALV